MKPYPYYHSSNPLIEHNNELDIFKDTTFLEFNNIIGLPQKNGKAYPIFDYELDVIKAIEEHSNIWIKKSRGIGITELILRFSLEDSFEQ